MLYLKGTDCASNSTSQFNDVVGRRICGNVCLMRNNSDGEISELGKTGQ